MPRTVRKHPIAFLHALGWIFAGLSMLYVMHYEGTDYDAVLLADAAVILFGLGCALAVITPVIWLAVRLLRRPLPTAVQEKRFRRVAARWYESTRPDFWKYRAAAIAAAVLPFLALFSVVIVEDYMPGLLLISIGLSIWLICICIEMPEARLLKVCDTADRFEIRSGASADDISRLEDANTLGIDKRYWDSRRDHLFNMLMKEGAVDERSRIAAWDCPVSVMAEHFGVSPEEAGGEEVIWIPMGQFTFAGLKGYNPIQKLFTHQLIRIANLRYQNICSTEAADYLYSGASLTLQPDETALLRQSGDALCLLCASAACEDPDTLYQGCMLQINGPQLMAVKWDCFENITPPDADNSEYFLSPSDAGRLYELVLKGAFPYEITEFTYAEGESLLAVELWADPPQGSCPVDERGVPFVPDDGSVYQLLIAYSSLRWHWMHSVDLTQTQSF